MSAPHVTVVVLNHDGRAVLGSCLDALRKQTLRDVEVVVVDNGSTDGSADLVEKHYPGAQLIALARNVGYSAGNNAGIQVARGRLVALLNNDTEPDPEWLAAIVRAETPEHAMWASQIVLHADPTRLDSAGDGFTSAGVAVKHGHLEEASAHDEPREVFGPSGAAAVYRRLLLEEIGGLDVDFFLYHEDVDLAFRARLRGHRCLYVPDARVRHRLNTTLGYLSSNYVYLGHRNLEFVFLKNLPLALLVRCLPGHLLFNAAAFCSFALRGRGWSWVRAKIAVLAALPVRLKKRRSVQEGRSVGAREIWATLERQWWREKTRAAMTRWRWERSKALPTSRSSS